MKIEEIRSKGESELSSELASLKKELFGLRFKSSTQSLPDPSRIRKLRHTIARMSTVIREREMAGDGGKAAAPARAKPARAQTSAKKPKQSKSKPKAAKQKAGTGATR